MKIRKHYTLSPEAVDYVERIASAHGLNHSQAADHLIKLGAKDDRQAIASFCGDVVAHEMRKQFNRFAKLSAMSALEAGAAKEATKAIYWWILLQEHAAYSDSLAPDEVPNLKEFEAMFSVDPESTEGKQILNVYGRRNDRFRMRAVKALRNGFTELDAILEEVREWDEGKEADASDEESDE